MTSLFENYDGEQKGSGFIVLKLCLTPFFPELAEGVVGEIDPLVRDRCAAVARLVQSRQAAQIVVRIGV